MERNNIYRSSLDVDLLGGHCEKRMARLNIFPGRKSLNEFLCFRGASRTGMVFRSDVNGDDQRISGFAVFCKEDSCKFRPCVHLM